MEIWPCTFLLITDVCELTYPVPKVRQGGTEIFSYSHLQSITPPVFHPSAQQVKLQFSQFKIFLKGIYLIESKNNRTIWIERDL